MKRDMKQLALLAPCAIMADAMIHAQEIPPSLWLEVWKGLVHTIGMTGAIFLFIFLLSFLFLAAAAIKGLCTRKGNTNNIITTTNTTYKVADHVENVNIGTEPTYKVWRGSSISLHGVIAIMERRS